MRRGSCRPPRRASRSTRWPMRLAFACRPLRRCCISPGDRMSSPGRLIRCRAASSPARRRSSLFVPFRLPLRPRTLVIAGLGCLLAALAFAALVPVVFGRPLSKVHLTWRSIEPDARLALEARFKLSEPQRVDDATWSYVPLDRSTGTYQAIVTNPAVEDTEGINRRTFAEADGPPLTERRGGLWPG